MSRKTNRGRPRKSKYDVPSDVDSRIMDLSLSSGVRPEWIFEQALKVGVLAVKNRLITVVQKTEEINEAWNQENDEAELVKSSEKEIETGNHCSASCELSSQDKEISDIDRLGDAFQRSGQLSEDEEVGRVNIET